MSINALNPIHDTIELLDNLPTINKDAFTAVVVEPTPAPAADIIVYRNGLDSSPRCTFAPVNLLIEELHQSK